MRKSRRLVEERPHVRVDPAQRFGRPTVKGLSTDMIASQVLVGASVEEVMAEYGVNREDVLVACWFEARYGSRRFRQAWKDWMTLGQAEALLWRREYGRVMDPPDRDELSEGGLVYGPLDLIEEITGREEADADA